MSIGLGIVVFDTRTHKGITPGLWKESCGTALNGTIRWLDFLKVESEVRGRVGKKLVYRYDKERNRI